jgi:hypothetical protein
MMPNSSWNRPIILSGSVDGQLVAGAVANRSESVVGISTVFAVGDDLDGVWAGWLAAVARLYPGVPVVGYEHGRICRSLPARASRRSARCGSGGGLLALSQAEELSRSARPQTALRPGSGRAVASARASLHQNLQPGLGHPLGAVVVHVAIGVTGFLLTAVHLIRALRVALAAGTRRRPALAPDSLIAGCPLLDGA